MVFGTSPPCSSTTPSAKPVMFFALFLKKPVLRMISSTSSSFAPARDSASGKRRNRTGVTSFTRSSVVWAERIVATESWKAFSKSSSQCASGYSSARRS